MVNLNEILHRLIAEFLELDHIIGITMSGSKVSSQHDDLSDINLDLYVCEPLAIDRRRQIILKFSSQMEMDQPYYVESDCFLLDEFPIRITLCYFNLFSLQSELKSVLEENKPKIGYSTSLIHHFLSSSILFERDQQLTLLQQKYQGHYPDQLKENIISLNLPLLKDSLGSYYYQLQQAINRQDKVAILSILDKFLKSYFDLLFAINKCYHPGEKRLIQIAMEKCQYCPNQLESQIASLMTYSTNGDVRLLGVIDEMIIDLKKFIQA